LESKGEKGKEEDNIKSALKSSFSKMHKELE
jgi:hypothetical protein